MTTPHNEFHDKLLRIRKAAFIDELTLLCHKYDFELVTTEVKDVHDYEGEDE